VLSRISTPLSCILSSPRSSPRLPLPPIHFNPTPHTPTPNPQPQPPRNHYITGPLLRHPPRGPPPPPAARQHQQAHPSARGHLRGGRPQGHLLPKGESSGCLCVTNPWSGAVSHRVQPPGVEVRHGVCSQGAAAGVKGAAGLTRQAKKRLAVHRP